MLKQPCRWASALLIIPACSGSSATAPGPPPPPVGGSSTAIQAAVREAYQREFGLNIPRPAIFNDERSQNCSGQGHLTSTAYVRSGDRQAMLHFMYMSRTGDAIVRKDPPSHVITPSGTFRTLVVVVRHGTTIGAGTLTLLEAAQRQINDDHGDFARSKGFGAPIVSFESTNVAVGPDRLTEPRNRAAVLAAAGGAGISTTGYDFVISLNIDPSRSEGGFATPGDGFVYVGNYSRWTDLLTAGNWYSIAATAYHHEVAHHWGWPGTHDWSPTCGGTDLGFGALITAPVLFGWEDVDGDGVPEILDQTPYGRAP